MSIYSSKLSSFAKSKTTAKGIIKLCEDLNFFNTVYNSSSESVQNRFKLHIVQQREAHKLNWINLFDDYGQFFINSKSASSLT